MNVLSLLMVTLLHGEEGSGWCKGMGIVRRSRVRSFIILAGVVIAHIYIGDVPEV